MTCKSYLARVEFDERGNVFVGLVAASISGGFWRAVAALRVPRDEPSKIYPYRV